MRDLKPLLLLVVLSGMTALAGGAAPDAAPPGAAAKPPEAPIRPVTETLFGRQVTDNYRYMEALDPATIEWMKEQGAYTRRVLDEIKPLARLRTDIAKILGKLWIDPGLRHLWRSPVL